jgi:hypothetical protein
MSCWENRSTGSAVHFLKIRYLISHSFSTNFVHFSHILPLEQTAETRSGTLPGYKHYQYKSVVLNLFCAMDPFESLVKPPDPFSEKCI